jgi:hypothetical protein
MPIISTGGSANLNVYVFKGILPYDPCLLWGGTATAPSFTTSIDIIDNPGSAIPNRPYILVDPGCSPSEGPLVISGTSTMATLYVNGFAGNMRFKTTAFDALGLEGVSNELVFISGNFNFVVGLSENNTPKNSSTVGLTGSSENVFAS